MKISREAWNLKEESFGPLLPYVLDKDITDINFNGTNVWVEHLKRGIYKVPVQLSPEFVSQFSIRVSNVVSGQINKYNNVLEAETDILRISIIPVQRIQDMQYLFERHPQLCVCQKGI